MKALRNLLLIVSGLLVLAWPLMLFGSIFAFDEPSRGLWFEVLRYTFVFAVLSYPAGYVYGCYRIFQERREERKWTIPLLLASPYLHLAIVFGLAMLIGEK